MGRVRFSLVIYNISMENNPINLTVRFVLELLALFAMGVWGWTQHSGLTQWVMTLLLPLGAAALWGVFRVPNDPGKAVVAVPGWVRLLLEALFFGVAVACLYQSGYQTVGADFPGCDPAALRGVVPAGSQAAQAGVSITG